MLKKLLALTGLTTILMTGNVMAAGPADYHDLFIVDTKYCAVQNDLGQVTPALIGLGKANTVTALKQKLTPLSDAGFTYTKVSYQTTTKLLFSGVGQTTAAKVAVIEDNYKYAPKSSGGTWSQSWDYQINGAMCDKLRNIVINKMKVPQTGITLDWAG